MRTRPNCWNECASFLRSEFASRGVEAVVSHLPPIVPTPFDSLDMWCPHGVLWYGEPTSDQMAAWARDGVL